MTQDFNLSGSDYYPRALFSCFMRRGDDAEEDIGNWVDHPPSGIGIFKMCLIITGWEEGRTCLGIFEAGEKETQITY